MKKLFWLVPGLLLLAFPAHAWNGSDHYAMTRVALEGVADSWHLQEPCEVKPLQSLLDKISLHRPTLRDAAQWTNYLRINSKTNLEALPPDLKTETRLTPLDILSLAALDPDDGRDQDLPSIYPDQKWFGSPKGPNSQAFRHIEKPPFQWRHPINTFGLPLRSVGESTRRAEIYAQASLLAFSLHEDYWGWRLLGGALHYLEDLHQPYHAGQITPEFLIRGLWAYLVWGHKKEGVMGIFAHLIANSHRFYETYVALPQGEDNGVKRASLEALKGKDYTSLTIQPGTIQSLAQKVRDESNLIFPSLIRSVTQVTTSELLGPYTFKADPPDQDNPSRFLKKGPGFEEANRRIFQITQDRFESAGKVIRSVIHYSLEARHSATPEESLQQLDQRL